MKILSNNQLLECEEKTCILYFTWFKEQMNEMKKNGENKKHNKMEVKYKKQRELIKKHRGVELWSKIVV